MTNAHYRSQLNFSDETLGNAARGLQKLKSTVLALKNSGESLVAPTNLSYLNDFEAAAFDDLNMPKAFASVWACTNDSSLKPGEKLWLLNEMDQILGFEMMSWKEESVEVSAEVRALMTARDDARKAKNWAESDRLRGEIQKHGFLVEDSAAGTRVKRG